MVRSYEYEQGYYEYTDAEGNKRIGHWEQKYQVDRGFYGGEIMGRRKVGVVDFYPDEDSNEFVDGQPSKRRECPHCSEYGLHMKLYARIKKDGEKPAPDDDLFGSCHHCFGTFALHEVKQEQIIRGFAQTSDNPFDDQQGIVMSVPSRTSPAGKKALDKRRREKNRPHHKDPEIDELL